MYKSAACILLLTLVLGCSGDVELLDEPAAFSGKLTNADGSPVGNVLLTLQPLENGHPVLLEVDASGKFQGVGVPGEYVYFLGASAKPSSSGHAALKKISADFLQANMEHKLKIGESPELNVQLHSF